MNVARTLRSVALLALTLATGAHAAAKDTPWWKHAVIYEIYPRSFQDTNGDGIGDLRGIERRLPYLQQLGVDAIWIAPFFASPQVDFGYDVSDYRTVDPQFGTNADLDRLIANARRRGIRVILDMVLNHTSDRHAWFVESAGSRNGPKADWYVWSDGLATDDPRATDSQRKLARDGRVPPNNWTSSFGGSAWEWVPARRQFYYHRFHKAQPDLNWTNPAVEAAMFDTIRFWLDRGVAGFRLDAVTSLFEDEKLRNEPETGALDVSGAPKLRNIYTDDLPQQHEVVRRLRALVDSYPGDRVLVGETWVADSAAMRRWYGAPKLDGMHLPMDAFLGFYGPRYTPEWFKPRLQSAQSEYGGGQPLFVFDNHDSARSLDKFADGKHDDTIAKGIATILYLSRATALTYYGAELGMRTRTPARREDVRDPVGISNWPRDKGRDGSRMPMPWADGPQGGFSTVPKTWLPIDPDFAGINVARQQAEPASLLRWTQRLIALRRSEPALRDGAMTIIEDAETDVLVWTRTPRDGERRVVVAINMGDRTRTLYVPHAERMETLATTDAATRNIGGGRIQLPPFSSWIGRY